MEKGEGKGWKVIEYEPGEKRVSFSVSYIDNGSVIDRIPVGLGQKVIDALGIDLSNLENSVMFFSHVNSKKTGGFKDLIKLPNRIITEEQYDTLFGIAPEIEVYLVENVEIRKKYHLKVQDSD